MSVWRNLLMLMDKWQEGYSLLSWGFFHLTVSSRSFNTRLSGLIEWILKLNALPFKTFIIIIILHCFHKALWIYRRSWFMLQKVKVILKKKRVAAVSRSEGAWSRLTHTDEQFVFGLGGFFVSLKQNRASVAAHTGTRSKPGRTTLGWESSGPCAESKIIIIIVHFEYLKDR